MALRIFWQKEDFSADFDQSKKSFLWSKISSIKTENQLTCKEFNN